jgi:hypothetical protein
MGAKKGMEEWNDGILEYWVPAVLQATHTSMIPLFQHSILLPSGPRPCREGVMTPCH